MINSVLHDLIKELKEESPDYPAVKNRIVTLYNGEHGRHFPDYDYLTDQQKREIVAWMNKNSETLGLLFFTRKSVLQKNFYTTISDKVSSIAQYHCPMCTDKFPMSTIPLYLSPQSYQVVDSRLKNAFKQAILHHFSTMPEGARYFGRKICLHIVFVLKDGRRAIDVDNMSKLLIDGLKDVLFSDDKEIVHLSVVKLSQRDPEEYIYVNIRESRLPYDSNVFCEEALHSFSVPKLKIGDFIDNEST